jgi:hypothetical protein
MLAAQNAVNVASGAWEFVRLIRPVANQAAFRDKIAVGIKLPGVSWYGLFLAVYNVPSAYRDRPLEPVS